MDSQQQFYLKAMGIQVWERRDAPAPAHEEQDESAKLKDEALNEEQDSKPSNLSTTPSVDAPVAKQEVTAASPQPVDDGIPTWLDEAPPLDEPNANIANLEEGAIDDPAFIPVSEEPALPDVAGLDWPALQKRVSECALCPELVSSRSQTVFGTGNPQADWMIISGAPTADEDKQGEPFVEKTGQLFNAMLHSLGLKRQQVYITNVIKCCTPENREPTGEEAGGCDPFIQRQIALVQPKVILAVGRIAAQQLLKLDTPIGKLRGRVHHLDGTIPVVVTYHPDYLLRSPLEKPKSWADLCLAKGVIDAEGAG